MSDFIADLRKLSTTCQALSDKLVCELRNEVSQRKLLAEKDSILEKALEIARLWKLWTRNARSSKKLLQELMPLSFRRMVKHHH